MTSLTLFTADPIRSALLEHLRADPVFQAALCVNSAEECFPSPPSVRTDALILDLSLTTPGQAQGMLAALEEYDYHPALLLFSFEEDGSICYTTSSVEEITLSADLENFFVTALESSYRCCRNYFRSAPWPEENTHFVFGPRTLALTELMYGTGKEEAQYYISKFNLDLHENGYYVYYWELYNMLFANHVFYKDILNFIGSILLSRYREILAKYNGGEVFYVNLTQLCVIINDFRLSSETQNRRRLNALLTELMAVSGSVRAVHYISKHFRSLKDFRSLYDAYIAERRMSFFTGKLFDSAASNKEKTDPDPNAINDTLSAISKYLNYDINNIELDNALRRLFMDILKPARNFPMYNYAASVLSSKLIEADPSLEKTLVARRLDSNFLRYSSIETEYRIYCNAIENLRQQIGSSKQSKSALMMKTLDFIHNNYHENILVSDIANALYVSETYLSRICKTLTGKSVIQHLIDYRIAQAKTALAEEDVAIYSIAEQCGFRDVRHFSKTFKKMTGMSPTEYRRSHF